MPFVLLYRYTKCVNSLFSNIFRNAFLLNVISASRYRICPVMIFPVLFPFPSFRIVFNKKLYPCRNISSGVLLYYICSAAHLLLLCFDVRPSFNRLLLVLLSLTSIILSGITGSISAHPATKVACAETLHISIYEAFLHILSVCHSAKRNGFIFVLYIERF